MAIRYIAALLLMGCTEITYTTPEEDDAMNARHQNFGNRASLNGLVPDSSFKLIRVEETDIKDFPWELSISSSIVAQSATILGPVVEGTFGSGGVAHKFEVDARPDSVLSLPGMALDCSARWDFLYLWDGTTMTKVRSNAGFNLLPTSALVTGSVKHGIPTVRNATRTLIVKDSAAGAQQFDLPLPPFSDEWMVYNSDDGSYADVASIEFRLGSYVITSYTGLQIQAIKNAGSLIPVPGQADSLHYNISVAPNSDTFFNMFTLNL